VTRNSFTISNNTITLEWNPPQGSGAETIVDYYRVSVTPVPLSHPMINMILLPPWNVTIEYNVAYTVSVTAVNCAGDSNTVLDIEYGKPMH
jgi:hypothetical protein